MSHGITRVDSVGIVNSRGWHGLGQPLPEGLSAVEGFQKVGLDWTEELLPVFCERDRLTSDGIQTQRIKLPDHLAHVRVDTGGVLGLVSSTYRPVTNQELATFADAIAGEDYAVTLDSAGSLHGGRRIFASVKLPSELRLGRGGADRSEFYVLISNGHGGTAAFAATPTTIRVVCNNTLSYALHRDGSTGIRFVHSGDLDAKLAQARLILGLARKETERFEAAATALASVQLSVGQTRGFLDDAWHAAFGALPDQERDPEAYERVAARKRETIDAWLVNIDNERQRVAGLHGTAWSALNAVTEWHEHERGRMGPTTDARRHSNLFGTSARAKRATLKVALELVP